jgi:hypothetical protein
VYVEGGSPRTSPSFLEKVHETIIEIRNGFVDILEKAVLPRMKIKPIS